MFSMTGEPDASYTGAAVLEDPRRDHARLAASAIISKTGTVQIQSIMSIRISII
jgi:hypothetical protein